MTTVQATLLDFDEPPRVQSLGEGVERTVLGEGAFVDVRRGFLLGADRIFLTLLEGVDWRAERRPMYDKVVQVPRLVAHYPDYLALPDDVLVEAGARLDEHYGPALGEPFVSAGLCYYRDGRDSVAWHGDTIGRGALEDTMVAIVSLGAARRLLLRRRGGGPSVRFDLAGGDLLVMGGSCQRTFEHAVPKTTRAVGPRISVQYRPRNVR